MRIIIIGSGLAGQLILRELRTVSGDAEVMMFSEHSGDFYSKPSLSNVFTQGKHPDALVVMTEENVSKEFKCEVYSYTSIVAIDRERKIVETASDSFPYDKLVIATGALPTVPSWLTVSDNVFQINHLEEYQKFYPRVSKDATIAIIGGGLIGVEFAHDIAPYCQNVILIESMPTLMASMLPPEIGKVLAERLKRRGVTVMTGVIVDKVHDDGVVVDIVVEGETLQADTVLGAIGIRPNIALAKQANLDVATGVEVNQHGQTSDEDIYSVGDCAEVCGMVRCYVAPLRVCAIAVAKNLMGHNENIVYEPMPVMVKTSSYPICFCYKTLPKTWQVSLDDSGVEALAFEGDKLVGFALSDKKMANRMLLKKQMASWLSEKQ
jgi:rubredoxin---NAD+ reductase